ncbi:MAG: FtsB family cell division protein [Chitinophagaceae bacterium]
MKKINVILPYITNKYLLSILGFLVWMLWFDERNIFASLEQKAELKQLEEKKKYYSTEIVKAQEELTNLQNNPAALEKFAREKYLMKRKGEEIFIIEVPEEDKKTESPQ